MSNLIKKLDEYIEYATNVKRFADVAFYEELKEKLLEQESYKKLLSESVVITDKELKEIEGLISNH